MRREVNRIRYGPFYVHKLGANSRAVCTRCGAKYRDIRSLFVKPVCQACGAKPFGWSPKEVGPDVGVCPSDFRSKLEYRWYVILEYMAYWVRCWELYKHKPPTFWLYFLEDRGVDLSDPEFVARGADCELPACIYRKLVDGGIIQPYHADVDFYPPPKPTPEELDRRQLATGELLEC